MLSSPIDGEVLAAIRGLKSTLKSAQMSLNDLGDIVEKLPEINEAFDAAIAEKQKASVNAQQDNTPPWCDVDENQITEDIKFCREHGYPGNLSPREKEFIDSIYNQHVTQGRTLSPKQVSWLADINRRLRKAYATKPRAKRTQGV